MKKSKQQSSFKDNKKGKTPAVDSNVITSSANSFYFTPISSTKNDPIEQNTQSVPYIIPHDRDKLEAPTATEIHEILSTTLNESDEKYFINANKEEFLEIYKKIASISSSELVSIPQSEVVFNTLEAPADTLAPSIIMTPAVQAEMKMVLESKVKQLAEVEKSLLVATSELENFTRLENQVTADHSRRTQDFEASNLLNQKLQETCRSQQKRNKFAIEEYDRLVADEAARTKSVERSCEDSIRDVVGSVDKEEELIREKEIENKTLHDKIMEFRSHILLRQEAFEKYKKQNDTRQLLSVATLEHKNQLKLQNDMMRAEYAASVQRQQARVMELEEQVRTYANKFSDFDQTLRETKTLFSNVEKRGHEIASKAYAIEQRNQEVFSKAEARQVDLENLLNLKLQLDAEYREVQHDCVEQERICRQKQARRSELLKKLDALKLSNDSEKVNCTNGRSSGSMIGVNTDDSERVEGGKDGGTGTQLKLFDSATEERIAELARLAAEAKARGEPPPTAVIVMQEDTPGGGGTIKLIVNTGADAGVASEEVISVSNAPAEVLASTAISEYLKTSTKRKGKIADNATTAAVSNIKNTGTVANVSSSIGLPTSTSVDHKFPTPQQHHMQQQSASTTCLCKFCNRVMADVQSGPGGHDHSTSTGTIAGESGAPSSSSGRRIGSTGSSTSYPPSSSSSVFSSRRRATSSVGVEPDSYDEQGLLENQSMSSMRALPDTHAT